MAKRNTTSTLGGGYNPKPNLRLCFDGHKFICLRFAFTLAEVLITLGIIGVVAAMVIPSLISSFKKHHIESELKHSYAVLNEVVRLAQADYGDPSGWDYSNITTFTDTYIMPYLRTHSKTTKTTTGMTAQKATVTLTNGTIWYLAKYDVTTSKLGYYTFIQVKVDVNGDRKPNLQGIDQFNFYIFPQEQVHYNTGAGHCAVNVPSAGIYYDGYGINCPGQASCDYRACDGAQNNKYKNSYCIAKIIENNWKIPKDYPLKF